MPFEQYIETLDPVLMHAGENAPHAYFIPFDADQDARGARESSCRFTLLNGQWEFKYYPSVRDFTADLDPMTEPLEPMACAKRPWQRGEAIKALTDIEPADSPTIVMRLGSPPKASILSFTHFMAATWSMKP